MTTPENLETRNTSTIRARAAFATARQAEDKRLEKAKNRHRFFVYAISLGGLFLGIADLYIYFPVTVAQSEVHYRLTRPDFVSFLRIIASGVAGGLLVAFLVSQLVSIVSKQRRSIVASIVGGAAFGLFVQLVVGVFLVINLLLLDLRPSLDVELASAYIIHGWTFAFTYWFNGILIGLLSGVFFAVYTYLVYLATPDQGMTVKHWSYIAALAAIPALFTVSLWVGPDIIFEGIVELFTGNVPSDL